MAEINRIHYELEYTEGISQRMRIPEKLQIAPAASDDQEGTPLEAHHSVLMQVPERILVAGGTALCCTLPCAADSLSLLWDSDETQYPRPRDLDLIQSTPLETLALKTPPRVLTLSERPLDFLEMEQSAGPAQPIEEGRAQVRLRRERSAKRAAEQKRPAVSTAADTFTNTPVPALPLLVLHLSVCKAVLLTPPMNEWECPWSEAGLVVASPMWTSSNGMAGGPFTAQARFRNEHLYC
ncbi:hypothetical protein JZ751_001960 [Albula glossodonta]|uniref:Mitochondrial fission factor n=1 Tax=Albula glossodonta TaxID=121402 RepID=A0A8T2P6P0_9TELE|nr:hypothetical protein JZ751_001960 [Albula glossodonta]